MNAEQRILAWVERADFDGTGCRHSQDTIARATGCSRRTVIRATRKLAESGRLTVEKERRPGCKWPCNVYRLPVWNPHKRSGVLNVLGRIREARKAECHTERTAAPCRAQTTVATTKTRALTSQRHAVEGPTTVIARASNEAEGHRMHETEADSLHRLPQCDYPGLHAVLDDVLILGVWVQRQALRWLPGPPDPEDPELAWLERYLTDLEHAAGVAREKVKWRRRMVEAAREREEDMCLSLQEPRCVSPTPAPGARSTAP